MSRARQSVRLPPHRTSRESSENTVGIEVEQDVYQRLSRCDSWRVPISADHFCAPTNSVRVVVSAQGERGIRL